MLKTKSFVAKQCGYSWLVTRASIQHLKNSSFKIEFNIISEEASISIYKQIITSYQYIYIYTYTYIERPTGDNKECKKRVTRFPFFEKRVTLRNPRTCLTHIERHGRAPDQRTFIDKRSLATFAVLYGMARVSSNTSLP